MNNVCSRFIENTHTRERARIHTVTDERAHTNIRMAKHLLAIMPQRRRAPVMQPHSNLPINLNTCLLISSIYLNFMYPSVCLAEPHLSSSPPPSLALHIHMCLYMSASYIYIYMCVCVCVCATTPFREGVLLE